MTKKYFIALADAIREFNDAGLNTTFRADHIDCLASFCAKQNPRFNRERWLGYIAGTNGKNGGKVKQPKPEPSRLWADYKGNGWD